MKINLLSVFVLITLFCSCKKTGDTEPDVVPSDKAPIITFDKTAIKSAYSIGDTIKLIVHFKDNGFGLMQTFYPGLYLNLQYAPNGSYSFIDAEKLDSVNINPPSITADYKLNWVVKSLKDTDGKTTSLKSGDTLTLLTTIKYVNKKPSATYNSVKLNSPSFKIK